MKTCSNLEYGRTKAKATSTTQNAPFDHTILNLVTKIVT